MFRHFQFKELDDNTPPSSLVKKLQVGFAVCGLGFTLAVAGYFSVARGVYSTYANVLDSQSNYGNDNCLECFDATPIDKDTKVLGCSNQLDRCEGASDKPLSCDGGDCEHVEESPTSSVR